MIILRLAWQSLWNRRLTALLTIASIALSVMLLLGVEKIRLGARTGFINTISGTDLIVGARAGDVQLLLATVFRIGNTPNTISLETLSAVEARPETAWVVPISLGDSHHGFRVMGTVADYFTRYKYRADTSLSFAQGAPFDDLFDVVIGARIARELGYKLGDEITLSHGTGRVSFGADHADLPFHISGILAPSNTPVDDTLHISLEAMEAIHLDWQPGVTSSMDPDRAREHHLAPDEANAALVGLHSKTAILSLQRYINNYAGEPITAVIPGVAFAQLWTLIGSIEKALILISAMVVFTALLGMVISILSTLNERRREMAILRALGARPVHIFALFVSEATALAVCGVTAGLGMLYAVLGLNWRAIEQATGLHLAFTAPGRHEFGLLLIIILGAIIAGLVPALRAYRMSLADGLSVRT